MELYEGYGYRISIIGADSSIIVDSSTGLIRGCIADSDENIIVDTVAKTFRGTLVGNIVDSNFNLVFDADTKEINLSKVNSKTIKGNLINLRDEVVYDHFHNTISNIDLVKTTNLTAESIKGNLLNNEDEIIYDRFHNAITNVDVITASSINADRIESENYSGNFCGNILDRNGQVLYNYEENKIDLSNVFEEILYSNEHLRFTCSKKFNFSQNINSFIDNNNTENYLNFDFSQVSIVNENTFADKDLAGMFGFFGTENDKENVRRDMFFGSVGFIVNCSDTIKNEILAENSNSVTDTVSLIPSDFVVINGRTNYNLLDYNNGYDFISDNALVFNTDGVLSAPVIKTGVHADMSKIANPKKGMIVFNDNIGKFQGYTGTAWVDLH